MERYKLNKGVFSFLAKQGLSVHDMRSVINSYAMTIGEKRPKKDREKWYSTISELIANDFKNFKKVYNSNSIKISKQTSYDDWYQESSMDGTFAYNGVADDF